MTRPFDVLGIAADADERTIKQAYARLLRQTRPDEDPAGFQRINEAYQRALMLAKARQAGAPRNRAPSPPIIATLDLGPQAPPGQPIRITHNDADARHAPPPIPARPATEPSAAPPGQTIRITHTDAPAFAARHAPPPIPARPATEPAATPPQPTVFDAQAFLAEYRALCVAGDDKVLSGWLMQHPAFWHLPTKRAAGQWLLRSLFESPEAMPEACFHATSTFFHFDDALGGIDPLGLRRVATRVEAAWLLKACNERALSLRAFGNVQTRSRKVTRSAVKRLSRPFHWWRDLPHALRTPATRRMAVVANTLCSGNPDDLPAPINRDHARFWMDACNPVRARIRLLLAALRCAVALVLVPLAWAALVLFFQHQAGAADAWSSTVAAWQILSVTVGVIVALYWVPIGTRLLFQELDALATRSLAFRLLMLALTPALCAAALLVGADMDATLGALVAVASMFIAFLRLHAMGIRRVKPFERVGLVVAFFIYLSGFVALTQASSLPIKSELLPILGIDLIALGLWAFTWYRRGFLHPRAPQPVRTSRRRSRPA